VVTGSRKGGVGKTSFAAGIAIAAGTVLDQIGHMACIVDANIPTPTPGGR
jgi:septum formation inhibitor-activating ATPase MinD